MIGVGYCPATHTDVREAWCNRQYDSFEMVKKINSINCPVAFDEPDGLFELPSLAIPRVKQYRLLARQTERDHSIGCINSKCGISDDPICEKIPHCGIYKPRCEYK